MDCPKCKSTKTHKNGKEKGTGKQKYKCTACGYNYVDGIKPQFEHKKIGMTLDEFRDKHDIEHIIKKTLAKLEKDLIYQKDDIVKLAGISYGAQGLGPILEAQSPYYGKTGGKVYYSHPDTIKMLKDKAKLN